MLDLDFTSTGHFRSKQMPPNERPYPSLIIYLAVFARGSKLWPFEICLTSIWPLQVNLCLSVSLCLSVCLSVSLSQRYVQLTTSYTDAIIDLTRYVSSLADALTQWQARSHGGARGAEPPLERFEPPPSRPRLPALTFYRYRYWGLFPPWNSVSPPTNDTWLRRCPVDQNGPSYREVCMCSSLTWAYCIPAAADVWQNTLRNRFHSFRPALIQDDRCLPHHLHDDLVGRHFLVSVSSHSVPCT